MSSWKMHEPTGTVPITIKLNLLEKREFTLMKSKKFSINWLSHIMHILESRGFILFSSKQIQLNFRTS
jgi:hypothetical protein